MGLSVQNNMQFDYVSHIPAQLKEFHLATYEIKLRAVETLHLPAYAGSALRGIFGRSFRRVTCTQTGRECKNCLLRTACKYVFIFETPGDNQNGDATRLHAPRPFILHVPLKNKGRFSPGEYYSFGITLVGQANELLPYFILAFSEAGKVGLGKGRGRFVLESVRQVRPAGSGFLYSDTSRQFPVPSSVDGYTLVKEFAGLWETKGHLQINFHTPGRFVRNGRVIDSLEFDVLVRALTRRLSWLARYHCNLSLNLDYKSLIEKAGNVKRTADETSWYDWERISWRQVKKIKLGGLVGRVIYGPGWEEFFWLLALGQIVHVGKGATFGLGRYSMQVVWEES